MSVNVFLQEFSVNANQYTFQPSSTLTYLCSHTHKKKQNINPLGRFPVGRLRYVEILEVLKKYKPHCLPQDRAKTQLPALLS